MTPKFSWAVGIFEGEGCISIGTNGQVVLLVGMSDEDVIRRLFQIFQCGSVYAVAPRLPGRKTMHVWKAGSQKDVVRILTQMLPLLGERRKTKACEALAHIKEKASHPRKPRIWVPNKRVRTIY